MGAETTISFLGPSAASHIWCRDMQQADAENDQLKSIGYHLQHCGRFASPVWAFAGLRPHLASRRLSQMQ